MFILYLQLTAQWKTTPISTREDERKLDFLLLPEPRIVG